MDPKQTIKKNLKRRSQSVDVVEKFEGIPKPTWVELSLIDVCNRKCIFCPKSNEDIASRFVGGKKSVFQGVKGKYKFPTDISPDASEEEQLQAFFDYMASDEKPKAPKLSIPLKKYFGLMLIAIQSLILKVFINSEKIYP